MTTEQAKYRITFTETLLGGAPGDPQILTTGERKKNVDPKKLEEERASLPVEEQLEKKSTVFYRDENGLKMWDYQMKGFVKEQVYAFIELGELRDLTKWSYKKAVDMFVQVTPRHIYFRGGPDGGIIQAPGPSITRSPRADFIREPGPALERTLRGTTMQGDRICLARSETLPPGTWFEFEIEFTLGHAKSRLAVLDLEDFERLLGWAGPRGFGQWRSGGWGKFQWERVGEPTMKTMGLGSDQT